MKLGNWWVEYKVTKKGSKEYFTPFTPCKPALYSLTRPNGNYWGGFHCPECANTCASFGKTEEQAWEFSHGTDDEKFCVFLGLGE